MAEILYQFVSSGHQDVISAFKSIEASAKQSTASVDKLFTSLRGRGRGTGVAAVGDGGFGMGMGGGGGAGRRAGGPVRLETLAQQVARDQERSAKRAAQQSIALESRVAKARKDILVSGLRDMYRQQDAALAAEKRHADRLVNVQKSTADRVRRIREASDEKLASATRNFHGRRADERMSTLGRIGGELKGAAIGAAVGGSALALGVGGAAVKEGLALQSIANRISINSRKSGQEFIDATTLRKEFEATALATNGVVSAEQVAAGQQKFISKTGNIGQAREFSTTFAKTAAATDTSYEYVASAGAELAQKFAITTAKEMQEALAAVTFGGKEGAFELADAASKYAKLASAGATFGLDKGVGGVRTLQGLSQIAMSSTGDSDTATSAVEAMFRQIVTNSDTLKQKHGVDVFTDASHTKTRSIETLLPEILAATGGDKVALQKIFGDEGKRAINPLIDTFTAAYGSATGKNGKAATKAERAAAGRAAVNAQLQSSINAPGTFKDIEMDAAQAARSPAARVDAAWARLTASMADKMVPALERMVDKVEVSQGAIDLFVGTFEALLDMIEAAAEAFRIIKNPNENPEYRKKKEQQRAKQAERELAELPSQEKVNALAAAGKHDEAAAMYAKLSDPAVRAKENRLIVERDLANQAMARIDTADSGLSKAMTMGSRAKSEADFAQIYQSLASATGGTSEWQSKLRASQVFSARGADADQGFLEGENADQRQARLGYSQALAADQRLAAGGAPAEGAPEMAAKGLSSSFAELMKAAKAATGALNTAAAAGRPSISHTPHT